MTTPEILKGPVGLKRTPEQRKVEFETCCIKLTQTQIAGIPVPTPPAVKTMIEIYIEAEEEAAAMRDQLNHQRNVSKA